MTRLRTTKTRPNRRVLTDEQEKELLRLRLDRQYTTERLANMFRVSSSTVTRIIHRQTEGSRNARSVHARIANENRKALRFKPNSNFTVVQQLDIAKHYQNGYSTVELAKMYYTSRQVIAGVLKRLSVERRPYRGGANGYSSRNCK